MAAGRPRAALVRVVRAVVLAAAFTAPLATSLGASAATPPAMSYAAPPPASLPAAGETTEGLTLEITSVTPTIARPGGEVLVRGRIGNTADVSVAGPTVRLRGSVDALTNRDDIRSWASGTDLGRATTTWDSARIPDSLSPGESAEFVLRERLPDTSRFTYGAFPVEVDIPGARIPTFVVTGKSGDYPPMRTTVLMPVTLAPQAALFGRYGPARLRAWTDEIGPEGRLTRLLAAGNGLPVLWAVDPTLLDPPDAIAGERPIDPAAGAAWDRIGDAQKAETALRRAFRTTLIGALGSGDCTLLPYADADLVAGQRVAAAGPRVRDLVGAAATAAATLQASGPHCRSDLLWPADALVSTQRGRELAAYLPGGRIGALVGSAASTPAGVVGSAAAWRTADGVPVLAYDESLSNALVGLATDEAGVVTGQRLLADSVALFLQTPSVPRQVLLAVPREIDFEGSGLSTALNRMSDAPWIAPSGLTALLAASVTGPPVADRTPPALIEAPGIPVDPSTTIKPAITTSRMAPLQQALAAVATTAKIRLDGPADLDLWSQCLTQLLSARWRADPAAYQVAMRSLRTAGTSARNAVAVTPETINFFAEAGRLQITVTNNLDVGLADLRVHLEPLSPWLRLDDQPQPVDIGPHSKAVVVVRATALAAGSVPIRASLMAPDGQEVATATTVTVRVRPTGDWIYWAMGAVAAVLLALGRWRTRRSRGARTAAVGAKTATGTGKTMGAGKTTGAGQTTGATGAAPATRATKGGSGER
jgi:hypothetical protein